jgi:hypothetical protein
MAATQTRNGKAFEFALVKETKRTFPSYILLEDSEYEKAKNHWNNTPIDMQKHLNKSANVAVQSLISIEPKIDFHSKNGNPKISFLPDKNGISGNVIDILYSSDFGSVGVSAKNNSDEIKGPRLSINNIEDQWLGGYNISNQNKDALNIIFHKMSAWQEQGLTWSKSNKQMKYSECYEPIMKSIVNILNDAFQQQKATEQFCKYSIGIIDYWQIYTNKSDVEIRSFNINNSITAPQICMPKTANISLHNKYKHKVVVSFDNGIVLNIRIKNDKTKIDKNFLKLQFILHCIPEKIQTVKKISLS